MKKLGVSLVAIGSGLVFSSVALAVSPDEEKAFLDSYRKAYESSDQAALEKFLYAKGADPETLDFFKMALMVEPGEKLSKVELKEVTPSEVAEAMKPRPGPSGAPTAFLVKPIRKLILTSTFADENGSSTVTKQHPVAEVDGKLVIPVPGVVGKK